MDPYVGEIRLFAGSYAPRGWAFCNGQQLNITQNPVLFSLIGVTYGGDGRTTFNLPDMRGMAPIHQGAGPGLTPRTLGSKVGVPAVTLLETQIPNHTHLPNCESDTPTGDNPQQTIWATTGKRGQTVYSTKLDTPLNPLAISPIGGTQSHNNMQPFVAMSFIIALEGVFPPKP